MMPISKKMNELRGQDSLVRVDKDEAIITPGRKDERARSV
jgi:hypothetical protein